MNDKQWLQVERATSAVTAKAEFVPQVHLDHNDPNFQTPEQWRDSLPYQDTETHFWMEGPLWADIGWKWTSRWIAPV